jgi:hypothetical protein
MMASLMAIIPTEGAFWWEDEGGTELFDSGREEGTVLGTIGVDVGVVITGLGARYQHSCPRRVMEASIMSSATRKYA